MNKSNDYKNDVDYFESFVEEAKRPIYDLEERTFTFAKNVRNHVKKIDKSFWNVEYLKQLIRSSGSIGANYIEANEFLGEKDFLMKVRISKREAKESNYWLRLLDLDEKPDLEDERQKLIMESEELKRILTAIINKRIMNQKAKI